LLLAGSHRFTELLILQTHIRLHHFGVRVVLSELRTEFWIVRGRQNYQECPAQVSTVQNLKQQMRTAN
jgi:hypothetical protein